MDKGLPGVTKTFSWDEPCLVLTLLGLNLSSEQIETVMSHKGEKFSLFIREREASGLYPWGTPFERWDFS